MSSLELISLITLTCLTVLSVYLAKELDEIEKKINLVQNSLDLIKKESIKKKDSNGIPKYGYWKRTQFEGKYECSNCGVVIQKVGSEFADYCPKCGSCNPFTERKTA